MSIVPVAKVKKKKDDKGLNVTCNEIAHRKKYYAEHLGQGKGLECHPKAVLGKAIRVAS